MSKNLRELVARNAKKLVTAVTIGGSVMAGSAMAAAPDYTSIGAGIAVDAVVAAVVSFGAIKIGPNFARWATNKIATFF